MSMTAEREAQLNEYAEMFRTWNKVMIWMWRLGLGRFINMVPDEIGQIMVLVNTGRKSGKQHRTPLNYALLDGDVYCMAGFGSRAQWYQNVLANPQVEVWLPDGWWEGTAEEVTDAPNRLEILRAILHASGFAASEFEGIDPHTITDEELLELAERNDYRLIRIRRGEKRSGKGGPGDSVWVWWLLLGLLIGLIALLVMARMAQRK